MWEKAKWRNVLEIYNGKSQRKVENPNGVYPIYGSGGVMGYADNFLCPAKTTIIGRKGSINNPLFIEEPFWNVDTAFGLVAKDNLHPKYLFYFCKTFNFLRLDKSTTLPSLTKSDLLEIEIPLPPLSIQEKIAAILDKADELRRKDQELQKKYDELAQAIFIDMFGDPVKNEKGWEVKKLGEICRKITDGTHHSPKNTNEGYKYVTAKHIKNCKLDFNSNPTYVSETDHKEIVGRCNPEFQDVLYIKDGATTGMAAVNTLTEEFSMLSSLALFKLNKNFINHDYLTYYLNADFVKENLIREFMAGAAIKRFTLQKIKNFNILLPPLHLQQAFAKKIELINEVKAKTNTTKSEELFQSLLRRAFKGELVDQYSVL